MVGCPVRSRGWILRHWHEHLLAAADRVGIEPELVFVGDVQRDRDSFDVIDELGPAVVVDHPQRNIADHRDWCRHRYVQMVEIRNALLGAVREVGPDVFVSLDSDILLHPDALKFGLETLATDPRGFAAVGLRAFLNTPPGRRCPTYAMFNGAHALRRRDTEGVIKVDVLMAAKIMSPAAYSIDYVLHHHGEDPGWSRKVKEAGLVLGWDGRTVSKHIMAPAYLERPDPRCDW